MSVGYNKQLYRTSTSNVYRSRPCQRGFTCHSFTAPSNRRISYGGGLRHAGIVSSSGLGSSIGLGGSVALGSSVGLGSNVGLGSSAGLGSNVVVNPAYNVGLDYNLSSGVGSYKSSYGTVPAAVSYHGLGAGPVIGGAGPTYGAGGDIMPPLITNVTVNESLLAPITMEIDPKIQAVHQKEKEEIKILNNRFAVFIERVRLLEQQNKMLETKWALLQEQTTSRSNIDTMFDAYIVNLQSQLDNLRTEKLKQEGDLKNMQGMVEDFRNKYEDEINKRAVAENEFVVIKKDVDATFMQKTEIEARLGILQDEINFLRNVYEAELHELQGQIKDTSVVVAMDNARNLDTDAIVSDVRSQYELITSRTRNEAEQYYKQRVEEMQTSASTYGEDLRSSKTELVELTRLSTRLVNEIELIKNQRVSLETQIAEAEEQGELAVKDAKFRITELEEALNTAKQELAKQLREYQELMTIKLALDIEITTYKTLLEGEEYRISTGGGPATVHVKDICTTSAPVRARAAGVGVGVPSLGLDVRGTARGYDVSGSQFSLGVGGSNLGFGGGSSNLRLGVGGSNLGMGVGGSCLDLGVGNVTGYGVNIGRSGRGNYGYGNYGYSVARSSAQSSHY